MPLTEAGFKDADGHPHIPSLLMTGPTIQVMVMPLPLQTETDALANNPFLCHALVDTGATESCIDIDLAVSLGLPQIDVITISGAGGPKLHPVYMCAIAIPALSLTQYGKFAGVHLQAGGQAHKVLLGRSFLGGVIMIYDGIRGQVTLAAPVLPSAPAS
jgi:predicted aspartyl protease